MPLELPSNLVESIERHDPPDSPRRRWSAALPALVTEATSHWSLVLERPYQPGGETAWVAPVRTPSGEPAVLKVGWRHDEAAHQALGLRTWDGRGTVRLLDALELPDTDVLLLERCEPGTTLADAVSPLEQDVVVAGLLRRLWVTPGHGFRPLSDMCDAWAEEFEDKYAAAPEAARIDAGLARAGAALMRELPRTATREALLCTDLHPGNVLAAQREPWLVIDPKPYVGDVAYDPLQHMLNFADRLVEDAAAFAARMAALVGLDGERVRTWLFARCVQESVDQPVLGRVATTIAP